MLMSASSTNFASSLANLLVRKCDTLSRFMTLTHRRLAAVVTPARAEARRGREVRPPVPDRDHGPENRFLEVDRVFRDQKLRGKGSI